MKRLNQLLLANKAWATEITEEDPHYFVRQTGGQTPEFLWIGCSDSRVSAEQITQTAPGGMFVHRNVANLVDEADGNLMSVLQFAVDTLNVRHVILCGHYACGGLMATLAGKAEGPIGDWLKGAAAVLDAHRDEICGQPSEEAQVNRFVEINVRDQLLKLARTRIVQEAWARGQQLFLNGWVYDLRDGRLKPLMAIDASTAIEEIGHPDPVLLPSVPD